MNIGSLKHKITIKVQPISPNSYGEEITDILQWNDFANLYASISPSSGREFYAAQQINNRINTIFIIRFIQGIIPSMKVLYGTRAFNILSAPDIEERHKEIHLICEEVLV